MGVLRLTAMVPGRPGVKVHVHQRRGKRTELHEHDERGGGQPTEHKGDCSPFRERPLMLFSRADDPSLDRDPVACFQSRRLSTGSSPKSL